MSKDIKIFVAGHRGMVGSAILKLFNENGYENLLVVKKEDVDLCNQDAVRSLFENEKPELVILAAAKVGGINANTNFPAQFLYDNLMIQNNIIHASYIMGATKIIFLGSSCIYPRNCPQPMQEDYLMSGRLEPTNEGYALAKIAGLKLLEYYYKEYKLKSIALMPPNLYGPNDHFDLEKSHVLSALVKKIVDAKENNFSKVTLWGTGSARREFMHVNDCAEAVLFFMENFDYINFVNIGWGNDVTIKELANMITDKVAFKGEINWDTSKPDGMPRKCLNIQKMREYGFYPRINLDTGIDEVIKIYYDIISKEKK
ncbi:MAG: GDP-L-fucose synthase [Ignavibacteria bacterium]|nr:GDP-L-fucose synthase [Ignavibacteria bacterium]